MNSKRLVVETLDKTGAAKLLSPIFAGRGVIFGFHRAVLPGYRSLMPGNDVTTTLLEETLAFLKRARYDCIPLSEIPERLQTRTRSRFAAFTFDDGYLDNLTHALPIFERGGVPFTVFPVTGIVDGIVMPWWVLTEWILLNGTAVELHIPDSGTLRFRCETFAEKMAAFQEIARYGFRNPRGVADAAVGFLTSTGREAVAIVRNSMLSWPQMRDMQAGGLATFGVHTVSHAGLTNLSEDEAQKEIGVAQRRLTAELGRPIRHIAYPFGWCGQREFAMARQIGFEIGLTVHRGTVRAEHDPLALPRIMPSVSEHANGMGFIRASVHGVWNNLANAVQRRPASQS